MDNVLDQSLLILVLSILHCLPSTLRLLIELPHSVVGIVDLEELQRSKIRGVGTKNLSIIGVIHN